MSYDAGQKRPLEYDLTLICPVRVLFGPFYSVHDIRRAANVDGDTDEKTYFAEFDNPVDGALTMGVGRPPRCRTISIRSVPCYYHSRAGKGLAGGRDEKVVHSLPCKHVSEGTISRDMPHLRLSGS